MKKFTVVVVAMALACSSPKSDQETFSEQQRNAVGPIAGKSTPSVLPELEKTLVAQGLVDIQVVEPSILVELKYSCLLYTSDAADE